MIKMFIKDYQIDSDSVSSYVPLESYSPSSSNSTND